MLNKVKINPAIVFGLAFVLLPLMLWLIFQNGIDITGVGIILFGTIAIFMLLTRPNLKK